MARQEAADSNEVGNPLYPVFMAKTGALFFFVFGALALLGTVAQINPIWLYGPYSRSTSRRCRSRTSTSGSWKAPCG